MGTKKFNFVKGILGIFVALLLTFTLIACGGDNDQELLDEAIDNLSVVFASGDSATSVTKDINLPTTLGEATVVWSSNNTTVLTNSGTVTRQFGNTPISLTATVTLNEATVTKVFSLVVVGHDVDAALEAIILAGANITYDEDNNRYTIIGNITLPTAVLGLDVTWVSTNPTALSTAGVVVRPVYGENNANVTLIASINDEERDFYIIVPAIPDKPIALVLQEAKDQLLLSGISDGVAQNITLPTTVGTEGVTVTWASNRLTIISVVGGTAIVARQDENEVVILTATLTKGDQSVTKQFEIVVLADEPAVEVDNIAEAVALGQGAFVIIPDVTILGITGDGVVFHDSSGILFAYFGSRRTELVIGGVYDVQGLTARFFGSWQLGNTPDKPIIFTPSGGEKTVITPVEVNSVTEMVANHHVPDATNPNINYVYYRLTAKIRIQSSTDNYGTVFVNPDYDGPDIPTAANSLHTNEGVIVYYHSNKKAFDALDGQIVAFNILLYGYRSDRNIFSTLYLETVSDIEVFSDQGTVDKAETVLRNDLNQIYSENTTLTLPSALFGTDITWASNNNTLINPTTGAITVPAEGSTLVTLTATIEYNDIVQIVDIEINVGTIPKTVIIYEVYGGGGNNDSYYKNDYIVLYNVTNDPINLTGYSIQYASATGSTWQVTLLTGTIGAGEFYLVQQAAGTGGTMDLPTPDATGTISMSGSNGKVALVHSTLALGSGDPTDNPVVIDFVGYGTANVFEGSAAAPELSNSESAIRKNFLDTNDNANDFELVTNGVGHLDYLSAS